MGRVLVGVGRIQLLIGVLLIAAIGFGREAGAGYADYVVDLNTGAVLRQTNADTRNYPASLTKIMTLFMVFEALDRGDLTMDEKLPVSRQAARQPASKLGLRAGETISVRDAIMTLVTKSANDVATVVAERLGDGREAKFAEHMTRRARALGMSRTTFRNASGLPNKGQLTTARDLSVLARALYSQFPHYAELFATRQFKYRGRTYRNHNNLLGRYEGMIGIKTGYIRASGYNLTASVKRNGHHVVAVVLGGKTARSRDRQMRKLLDRAYAALERRDMILKLIQRPSIKPPPDALVAQKIALGESLPVPATQTGLQQAADIVGVALSSAVGIPAAHAATTPPGRRWGVQVGAFSREDAALRALDHAILLIPDAFRYGQSEVSVVDDKYGTLFRARHIGLNESEARHVCSLLKDQNLACVVATPEAGS